MFVCIQPIAQPFNWSRRLCARRHFTSGARRVQFFFSGLESAFKITFYMEIAAYCSNWNFNFCEENFWLYGHCDGFSLRIEQPNANIYLTNEWKKAMALIPFYPLITNDENPEQGRCESQLFSCRSCKFRIHSNVNKWWSLFNSWVRRLFNIFLSGFNRRILFCHWVSVCSISTFVFDMIFHCLEGKNIDFACIQTDYLLYV